MGIKIKQLIEDRKRLREKNGQRCANCDILLQETITGRRYTEEGDLCSDCYYEEIGEVLDERPIASGRVRRG